MTLPNYTMNDQIQQLEIQYLKTRIAQLEVERDCLKENVGMLVEETFSLEFMLDAIGAGGVGQSIRPPVQMDTAPAAWAILSDDGTAIRLWSKDKATAQEAADKYGRPLVPLYTAPQPTENLRCKSTQKRLAMLWGYVKQEPARQPLPADTHTAPAKCGSTAQDAKNTSALPRFIKLLTRGARRAYNSTHGFCSPETD